jgi:hypothetical protein
LSARGGAANVTSDRRLSSSGASPEEQSVGKIDFLAAPHPTISGKGAIFAIFYSINAPGKQGRSPLDCLAPNRTPNLQQQPDKKHPKY